MHHKVVEHHEVSIRQYIGTMEEAPHYTRDNEFIKYGYRVGFHSIKSILKSLFMCHNEFINVWTHLIGIFIFIGLIVYILSSWKDDLYGPKYKLIESFIWDNNESALFWEGYENQCFVDEQLYQSALTNWINEVELKCHEYFSNHRNESWHSLLKFEGPKTTFKQFMLMERDPYIELTKQIEYFSHTEINSLNLLVSNYSYDPHKILYAAQSILYDIQDRIDDQLDSCKEIFPKNMEDSDSSLETLAASKMIKSYKIIHNTLHKHFSSFIEFIIKKYNLLDSRYAVEHDDVFAKEEYSDTKMKVSIIPLILHMLAAITWFGLSSTFHLFGWHSDEAHTVLSRLDYGGIVILIGGSTIPPYIYTFYWGELWYFGLLYTIAIDSICLIAFISSLIPMFDKPKYRSIRAILFVLVGLTSGLPGIHVVFFRDPFISPTANVFLWSLGGAIYVSGAFIYACRFPERYFKGRFSFFGSSHNIWHWFVLGAAITHFFASLSDYHTRTTFPCPA